jgi:hypothetical protein
LKSISITGLDVSDQTHGVLLFLELLPFFRRHVVVRMGVEIAKISVILDTTRRSHPDEKLKQKFLTARHYQHTCQ